MNTHEITNRRYRPPIKTYDGSDYTCAHLKRDGHMVRIEVNTYKVPVTWQVWTRRPTNISHQIYRCWHGLSDLIWGLDAAKKGDWLMLGELYYPSQPSSYIKTGLTELDTSVAIEVFALLRTPYLHPSELAGMGVWEIDEICSLYDIPFVPYLDFGHLLPSLRPRPEDLFRNNQYFDVEGYVLKKSNLQGWQRWKAKNTIDLIVSGYTDGIGKYLGMVGSLKVQTTEGIEVACISGMTDEERRFFSENRGACIGCVVEVEYQYVGAKGRLRHPQFKGLRDDKRPNECSMDQDPKLSAFWRRAAK